MVKIPNKKIGTWYYVRGLFSLSKNLFPLEYHQKKNSLNRHIRISHFHHDQGFSLISTLVAIAISGIIFSAFLSMMMLQRNEGNSIRQQLARASLTYSILQTLRNPESCLCQFRDVPSTPHTINTIKSQSDKGDEFPLIKFTNGCGSSANVLAKSGMNIGASLKIKDLKLTKIKTTPSPEEYAGDLVIEYQNSIRSLKPTTIPLTLTASGTNPSAHDILSCRANTDFSDEIAVLTSDLNKFRNELTSDLTNKNDNLNSYLGYVNMAINQKINTIRQKTEQNNDNINDLIRRIASLDGGTPPPKPQPPDPNKKPSDDSFILSVNRLCSTPSIPYSLKPLNKYCSVSSGRGINPAPAGVRFCGLQDSKYLWTEKKDSGGFARCKRHTLSRTTYEASPSTAILKHYLYASASIEVRCPDSHTGYNYCMDIHDDRHLPPSTPPPSTSREVSSCSVTCIKKKN